MHAQATKQLDVDAFGPRPTLSPTTRARQKLHAAIALSRAELIDETSDLDNRCISSIDPSGLVESLVGCAEGSTLNLRKLDLPIGHGGYADQACAQALVVKRLPASAWRDLQSACEQRFTGVILPDVLGSDAALCGLRGLRSLRDISMRLDPGARTVDLRTLADFLQPIHVEVRCPSKLDVEVLAPDNVSVSGEIDGDSPLANCRAVPSGESAIAFFDRAVRIAPAEGVRYRLSWNDAHSQTLAHKVSGNRASWLGNIWEALRTALSGRQGCKPVAAVRNECFTALEAALAGASRATAGFAPRYQIRSQALHVIDSLHGSTLALADSMSVGPLLLSMRQDGWAALERYCRARHGCGIRTIQFPAKLAALQYNKLFLANLDQLRELSVVQFGDARTTLPPRIS